MEHQAENSLVFHGSPKEFDQELAIPKRNIRSRLDENGERKTIFDENSFHATPHRWIALAYTYSGKPHEIDGKISHYNMGVSLYDNNNEVAIYGFNSSEESLKELYGDGGYLYHFDKNNFIYKEGLGNLEVITNDPTMPLIVERVENPVLEMKKLGVTFTFIDLALPENESYRNYY